MAGKKNLLCVVVGHKWTRQRRPDRTVPLTCRRCDARDVVTKDIGQGGVGYGAGGGLPGV